MLNTLHLYGLLALYIVLVYQLVKAILIAIHNAQERPLKQQKRKIMKGFKR